VKPTANRKLLQNHSNFFSNIMSISKPILNQFNLLQTLSDSQTNLAINLFSNIPLHTVPKPPQETEGKIKASRKLRELSRLQNDE
jgi:hypothetical protein